MIINWWLVTNHGQYAFSCVCANVCKWCVATCSETTSPGKGSVWRRKSRPLWRDSSHFVTRLIHIWHDSNSHVWHMCHERAQFGAGIRDLCDVARSYVTLPIRMCDATCVWCKGSIWCRKWRPLWRDSTIRDTTLSYATYVRDERTDLVCCVTHMC